MSEAFERKLLSQMTTQDGISRVWDLGLRSEVFGDPTLRFVFEFMVDYWLSGHMKNPPTAAVMQAEYPRVQLTEEVMETTDWLVDHLKSQYASRVALEVLRQAAHTVGTDPVQTLQTLWQDCYEAAQVNVPRYARVDITATVEARRERYARDLEDQARAGVPLGLDELDDHTRGILPGELCAAAAYTKTGKSWLLAHSFVAALRNNLRPIFFSLEMGIPEIEDRIDALYSGVSFQRLSQRSLTPQETVRLRAAQDEQIAMREAGREGLIERPQRGDRTVKHMVSRARQADADLLIIDQLSFIDAERQYSGDSALRMKHGDLIFELKDEIARESAGKIPCLLAVQLNRQAAASGGRGELYNFANSSMVEQTVDLALGLWRNTEMRANNAMGLDIMGSRRCDTRSWTLAWHLTDRSEISVREEYFESGGD
jgi:replicative DNA helicase